MRKTKLRRTFAREPVPAQGQVARELVVAPADVAPVLDDFLERLAKVSPSDPRADLLRTFGDPAALKVVWRGADGRVLGAAVALVEGAGADVALLHVVPRQATASASDRLLKGLLAALPQGVTHVRASDRAAHQWLHLPPADSRRVLEANGFAAFDRVLLVRDLTRPIEAPASLAPGFALSHPDPAQTALFADFAFRAYRGTTDFHIIAPDGSPDAYRRLYARFLGGELGAYAAELSYAARAPQGELAAVVHTILVGDSPYVGDVSVLDTYRRQGLGRGLLLSALHAYRQAGYSRTALTVTAQNTPAFNLYRSVGFTLERSGSVYLLAR